MDLGNLNLRIITPGSGGEDGGAKGGRKNAGEAPAEGGFAAMIASLLSVARGEAKPAGGAVPVQTQGVLAKAAAAAQTLVAAETASSQPAAAAPDSQAQSQIQAQTQTQTQAGQQAPAPPLQPVPLSKAGPAGAAAAGEVTPQAQGRSAFQNALLRNGAADAANNESAATIKPLAATEAAAAQSNTAAKTATAGAVPGAQPFAEDALQAQPRTAAAERADLALRDAAGGAPAPSGNATAGTENTAGRASAANAPQASQSIVAQLAQQLTYAARGGMQHLRFQLHPAELGQVSIQLRIRDGAAKVVISADNPAAVETMRQAAGALHQSLQAAGVQLDREHLSFQQQGGGQFASGDEARREGGRGEAGDHGGASRGETAEPPEPAGRNNGLFL